MLDNKAAGPAFLLKGAAVLFGVLGLGMAAWLAFQGTRHPEIRARQFDFEAPLWTPMIVFVLACMALAALLFWRAARRVEAGEDLFSRRHRRSPRTGE